MSTARKPSRYKWWTTEQSAAALAALPGGPQNPPQTITAPEPEPFAEQAPVDFASMSDAEYAAYRRQAGIGVSQRDGVGILNQVPQSDASAARRQAERHSLSNANVQAPPRIGRVFLNHDEKLDSRSARDRFSTPGNSWQG